MGRHTVGRSLYQRNLLFCLLLWGIIGPLDLSLQATAESLPVHKVENASAPKTQPDIITVTPSKSTSTETSTDKAIKPSFVTLTINKTLSQDTEIIQWPDGGISIPIKTFAALFDITAQQSEEDKRLFFIDPATKNRVDIYWDTQTIQVNDQTISIGKHPIVRNKAGLLVGDDIYVDQTVAENLLNATFKFDSDATTLTLSTERKLKSSDASRLLSGELESDESNMRLIRNPEIVHSLVEKIYLDNTSTYTYQANQQPSGAGNQLRNTYIYSLLDSPTVGISGSIFGQSYYIKPSFVRFNGKANFQDVNWSIEHPFKNSLLSLGSTDAGLSPLASPTLRVWALKLASNNATSPFLNPRPNYTFSGKAESGNQVSIRINNHTLQTVTAQDGTYEFEPVTLQAQTINHLSIVEKDTQNREKLLLEKDIANFQNLLPKGEVGYSTFLGRAPLQFYPLIPDLKTPILMPRSEKWLAGGRFFYGLSNRLTVGLSTAADTIFGRPKTYFTFLNPFSVDLTGFSSYQRDPNFTSGETMDLSLRYQLRDNWLATLDTGISHLNLRSGTLLPNPDTDFSKAAQFHLERQGNGLSWFFDAFHYDPYYYTPTTLLFGNNLYDKQGIGTGISGTLSKYLALNYNLKWSYYKTNLEQLIPGGFIHTNNWSGTINGRINNKNSFAVTLNWLNGSNQERNFIQKSLDLTYHTQSLPWGITGDVRASHYFTNTLFFPSKALGTDLVESPYHNNILNTSLDIPFGKTKAMHIKLGNQFSTFVDFSYIQGIFRFKNLFFEPLFQKSYGNKPQTQDRIGARLGYELKSGARFSISYYKNTNLFIPSAGQIPASKVKTDQFYVDVSDIIGLLGKHPHSLGSNADSLGIISGTVFADYSANGKLDKQEPGIKNIKLMIDKQQVAVTDQHGQYLLTGLTGGYHTVEVLSDTLPFTLNMENPIYKIKIQNGKNHRLNICLTPEGGELIGNVTVANISSQAIAPKDIILVLKDPNNNLITYTSPDDAGLYKFNNIPPGHYTIDLEERLKLSGRYKILEAPQSIELDQPRHYEDITQIKNLNFRLLAL